MWPQTPFRPVSLNHLLLVAITALLCVTCLRVAGQQSPSTQITFSITLADLAEWSGDGSTIITIELTNPFRPSESPKRIIVTHNPYRVVPPEQEIKVLYPVSFPLSQIRDKVFVLDRAESEQFQLSVDDAAWAGDAGSILFKNTGDPLEAFLISAPVDPGNYIVAARVQSSKGAIALPKIEQGCRQGENTVVWLRQQTRFSALWQMLFTREGVLGTVIVALITILVGVLRENIKTGFNKLLDLLGKYVGGRLAEKRFLKRYLENLIFNHKYLRLIGFYTTGISRPLLEEVFVSLRIASNVAADGGDPQTDKNLPTISFQSAFRRYRCMAILGGPGAGKTTTLSYTLLAFAKGVAREQLGVKESLIPIYIPLRRLTNSNRSIIEEVVDKDTQILSAEILKEYPANYFERKLKRGECLLLLDGLDEVLDEKTHRQIAERINSLVGAYPGNRFIITCRTAGWKDLLSGDFAVLSAQDFNREEIQRFVLGWHKAVITQSEYSRLEHEIPDKKKFEEAWAARKEHVVRPAIDIQSRSLVTAIDSNNRILAIAVNPMLLSLISLVHFNRRFLPRGRTVLYSQCLDLLIDSWDRTRDILSLGEGVSAIQKEAVLREIAFDFQTKGRGEDSRENLENLIATIAARLGISTSAKDLLEDIETRSGLLVERSLDVFGFSHLTLQEYLVARHIQLNHGHIGWLERNLDNQGWREVILLHTGLVDDATEIITGVAASDTLERQILAGYCVGDARHCNSDVAQKIIDRLLAELARSDDRSDELVNVIAAIAADFKAEPRTVEEQLSWRLIEMIKNQTVPATERLQAIKCLGRARVTAALPALIALVDGDDEAIRKEVTIAIVQFGDLALKELEPIAITARNHLFLVPVLEGINTGSAALLLLRAYDTLNKIFFFAISWTLARMMTNPLVESELLELDATELPTALRQIPIDSNGWSYESAKSGMLHLDTELRHECRKLIQWSFNGVADSLDRFSFKILFPALLEHIERFPNQWRQTDEGQASEPLRVLSALGFDKDETNKLPYLIKQIQTQFEMPLELALQRIGKTKSEFNHKAPRRHKLWVSMAKAYFVLFFLMMVFFEYTWLRYMLAFPFARKTMETDVIVTLFCQLALSIMYLAGVVITKHKLKRRFFSKQFLGILVNPIGNFLKVLPYLGKWRPSIKLIVLLVALIFLSPFPAYVYSISYFGLDLLRYFPFLSPLILTEPFLLVPLTIYYWKHHVLAQNPVLELMMMHPRGRQLIGETS